MSMFASWMHRLRSISMLNGITFTGKRNMPMIFGYVDNPTFEHFLGKYLRQEIASRIINMPVDACWADPPQLFLSEDGTLWEEWNTLVTKMPIMQTLRKADIFAGIGHFAVVVIGFDDRSKLELPVNNRRQNKITYMQPYLEGSVEIVAFDEDVTSPRFGKPVMYEIVPGDIVQQTGANKLRSKPRTKFKVHYSRVLHLADNTLEDSVIGHSRLEPVYNVLDDIMKVAGGSAETFWLTANRGLHVNVDKDVEMAEGDEDALTEEIEEYQHELRRVIRSRGVEVKSLGGEVVDPRGSFGVQISLLSANTGIPQRVLLGAEAGQLASQQDRANWSNYVSARVSLWAEPHILRPFLQLLHDANVLIMPETLYIKWPESFKMSPFERAQTSAQMARSAVNVARTLEVGQKIKNPIMSTEEAREVIAPGDKLPIFKGLPKGQLTPPIEEVDPQKFQMQQTQPNGTVTADNVPNDPDTSRPTESRGTNA